MNPITEEWFDKAKEDLDVASEIIYNVKKLLEQFKEEGHENNNSNQG
jgi:hypothetical protein